MAHPDPNAAIEPATPPTATSGRAVIAAQLAQSLEQIARIVSELLSARAVLDQAVGVLMSRSGSTAGEALDLLDRMSRTDTLTLPEVAQRVVDSAGRDRR